MATELHLALVPLLVEAGVPRDRARAFLDERLPVPNLARAVA